MKINHNNFLKLAFNIARVNLGKTKKNPSVGCVVVKDQSVISSGCTSLNGRPHAEFNSLKTNKNFKDSDLYVTMEPCTHKGITPPCTQIIKKKKIKRVFFSFFDLDKRTKKKAQSVLSKKNIKAHLIKSSQIKDFYQSYYLNKKRSLPLVDAKIAISKDYFTISKKGRWITNLLSRLRVHLIRSEYDSIISTSKSINRDNSLLNCRLNGFDKTKPDLIIIDINLRIKKKIKLFKEAKNRKIYIITSRLKSKKFQFLKEKGVKIIFINSLNNKIDFIILFKLLKKHGFNRILVESGLIFLNKLLENNLIYNLYIFKSSIKLNKMGVNNTSNNFIKKFKLGRKIKVNLNNDNLYKVKIK